MTLLIVDTLPVLRYLVLLKGKNKNIFSKYPTFFFIFNYLRIFCSKSLCQRIDVIYSRISRNPYYILLYIYIYIQNKFIVMKFQKMI